MTKVVIDMTMSLDGFVAGPDDGKKHPLGTHGGEAIFDCYTSGTEEVKSPLEKLSVSDGPLATHIRYRVLK